MSSVKQFSAPELPPALLEPKDELREGLGMSITLATEQPSHAAEEIQKTYLRNQIATRDHLSARAFGKHHALRLHRERAALSQIRRAAGLQSSLVALETSLGLRHDINWSDVLNTPSKRENPLDVHTLMEQRQNNEDSKTTLRFRF